MKTKILFFLPVFTAGGAAASIIRIIEKINRNKFDIYVISIGKNSYKKPLKKFCKKIFELEITKTIFSFKKIVKILDKFSKEKVIFVSNINYANILSVIYLKILNSFSNLKLVTIERTPLQELSIYYSVLDYIKKKISLFLIYLFYKKSDFIICNSYKTKKDFETLIKKKCFFIYPQPISKNKRFKKRIIKSKFRVMTISRLSKEKRIEDLITAISKTQIKNIELNILGEGKYKDSLIKLSNNLKLSVNFIKYSFESEKKYFKKSNLYVNSSDFEGFPSSVVQALNETIPVICSKSHGGIYEILNHGKLGKLYEARNSEKLSKLIEVIYKNYDSEVSRLKNKKKYFKKFLNEKNFDKYNIIFNNL